MFIVWNLGKNACCKILQYYIDAYRQMPSGVIMVLGFNRMEWMLPINILHRYTQYSEENTSFHLILWNFLDILIVPLRELPYLGSYIVKYGPCTWAVYV